ncbi:MAG: amino acid ABC transporter substrate-binding protein [Alphaproteobacteria bacterium]|nr:amino acid ABC transporter substrate-binding protein [Alphaproteobacteria bacterium]MCW5743861.1 amino acid ABC transporter substrate-binding protein [Alphaproteobacteria bacterium]
MGMGRIRRRTAVAGALAAGLPLPALAQGGPIKIGMSMPLTGGLAAGGKSALLGIEVWRDDINEKGGLLGRKVEMIVYDDKSSAAETPAIYSKLLDVDKVDLIFAPYATVPTAPIMPMVKQRDLLLMGNFSFQVNRTVKHDKWFNNAPWGPADSWARAFVELGMKSGAESIALIGADQEFAQNLLKIAKAIAEEKKLKVVYEQSYPPATVEFSAMVRAIRAARPGMVFVCSYPPDSAGLLRAVNEIGVGESVKVFGGGMVGLQFSAVAEAMGSLLNGVVNYNSYLPEKSMEFPGSKEFFAKYQKRAVEAKVDPLGYYLAPFGYAMGQMIEQAAAATKSIDHKKLADFLRSSEMPTIVGPIAFAADGERKESATLMAQYRGVVDKNLEQFRNPGKQIILFPEKWKTGDLVQPFEKARKG